jgi:hypothetical protein
MIFDFKSFHLRSIHAESDQDRLLINVELKNLYDSLTLDEKQIFNLELQKFLITEVGKLGSDYEAIKNQASTK